MGWLVLAAGIFYFIVIEDIHLQQKQTTQSEWESQSAQLYASQMLMLANRVNDYRYKTAQSEGSIPLTFLGLPFTLDRRIQHTVSQGRLWIWMPEEPGLVDALQKRSRGSALVGVLHDGQLHWLSGANSGLVAPESMEDGVVVYIN
ncbi:type IV pilus biogenesis protein PilM [Pectobacterium atrosepticum]|uniref:type IV pilus biogenesis protein PilM n=1 Tax=Pectobacterium atrosepticum TaxID=29471 RepID=UPI003018970F